jgi:endonuclease/exonuclease/phosphatase family metal-dependent hydrolase
MGVGILAIILSFPALRVSFAPHLIPQMGKAPQQFSVMTFNTSSMGLKDYKEVTAIKNNIYQAIEETSPGILCLQEFYTNNRTGFSDNITDIQKRFHYPYFYFTCDKTSWYTWQYGIILFSKYPIVSAQTIPCGHSSVGSGSSILQADILVHEDTIRVITAQLQSYMFKSADYSFIQLKDPADMGEGKSLIGRMRRTIHKRAEQARQMAALIAESPYPTIVCGDFNDTPVSYTYNTISNNMQDAFLYDGWGLGRTLSFLSPTLRIDYILAQQRLEVLNYRTIKKKGFEHYPVTARFVLKKD